MFPEDSKNKNYRVKAEIYSHIEEYDNTSERHYHILKVYFSNGGYVTFNNDGHDEELELNKKVYVIDDEDRQWQIELTNQKIDK